MDCYVVARQESLAAEGFFLAMTESVLCRAFLDVTQLEVNEIIFKSGGLYDISI